MKIKVIPLIVIILILLLCVFSVSYSYFTGNVIGNGDNETSVVTGKVDLSIDDESISSVEMAPIYDTDYEMLAFHKSFSVISSNDSLNSCANIYLQIDSISDGLKSELFKYKIISSDVERDGNFLNASNNSKMLLLDKQFVESGKNLNFDLYIWVSYDEKINQIDMLSTSLEAKLIVEGTDSKERSMCNN